MLLLWLKNFQTVILGINFVGWPINKATILKYLIVLNGTLLKAKRGSINMCRYIRTTYRNLEYSWKSRTYGQCNFLLIHSLSNPHLIFHPHHLKILQHHNHMLPLCWSRAFAQGFFTHWNTLLPVLSLGYLINSSFIFQLRFLYWTPHFLFLQPNFKQRDAYFFLFSIHSTIHANLASLSSMKTVSDAPV